MTDEKKYEIIKDIKNTYNVRLDEADLNEKIYIFIETIKKHNKILGEESVWLFVATLACYSVPWDPIFLKLLSIILVIVFYGIIIDEKRKSPELYKDIQDHINNCIEHGKVSEEQKEALKNDLNEKTCTNLAFFSRKSSNVKFIIGISFWTITLIYFLIHLKII